VFQGEVITDILEHVYREPGHQRHDLLYRQRLPALQRLRVQQEMGLRTSRSVVVLKEFKHSISLNFDAVFRILDILRTRVY